MCLLITTTAAIITTLVWRYLAPEPNRKVGWLALIYWGASLMWLVDGTFRVLGGEPFVDLGAADALLGLLVVASGLVARVLVRFISGRRAAPVPDR